MSKFKLNEKVERDFKGVWIPAELYLREDLNWNEKILLIEINSLDKDKEKGCFASDEYLAGFIGKKKDSVSKMVAKLKRMGLLKRVFFDGRIRGLRIVKTYEAESEKLTKLDCKNLQYSNNNNINNNIELIKINSSSDELQVFKKPLVKKIMKDWNKLEITKGHRHSIKKRSRVIKNIEKFITQFKDGSFFRRDNKVFDPDWLKNNRIPNKLRKLSTKQIQHIIKTKLPLYLTEGYYPIKKDNLRLENMLYNPYFQKSLFLEALYNPPKPIQLKIKDPDPETSSYLIKHMNGTFTSKDNGKLFNGIKSISRFVDNIPKDSLGRYKIRSEIGSTYKISREYMDWLGYQDWLDEVNVSILNTENKVWKKFIKEKEDQYDGYLLS